MQSQRSFARLSAIISLLGSVLVIYGVFFLPMALGNGGGSFTPTSEWMVAYSLHYIFGPIIVLVALPMLSVLFVLGTSVASFFRELSPGLVIWRRRVALAGLIIQSVLGLFMVFIYTFGFDFGGGFWVVLLGFVVIMIGTLLNSSRPE